MKLTKQKSLFCGLLWAWEPVLGPLSRREMPLSMLWYERVSGFRACFQTWPFPLLVKPTSMDALCAFTNPECSCFLQCPALCPPGPPGPPGMPGFKVRKMLSAVTKVSPKTDVTVNPGQLSVLWYLNSRLQPSGNHTQSLNFSSCAPYSSVNSEEQMHSNKPYDAGVKDDLNKKERLKMWKMVFRNISAPCSEMMELSSADWPVTENCTWTPVACSPCNSSLGISWHKVCFDGVMPSRTDRNRAGLAGSRTDLNFHNYMYMYYFAGSFHCVDLGCEVIW